MAYPAEVWVAQPMLATEVTVYPEGRCGKGSGVRNVLCNLRVKVVISAHLGEEALAAPWQ